MSTKKPSERALVELAWEEVARALFVARGIRSGLWHLAVRVQFAATTAGFELVASEETSIPQRMGMPTGMVGMQGLVLIPVEKPGLMVFDAAGGSLEGVPAKKVVSGLKAKKRAPARQTAPR